MRSRKSSRKDSIKSAGQEAANYLQELEAYHKSKPYGEKTLYKRHSEVLLELKKERSQKKKGSLKLYNKMYEILDPRGVRTMQRFETDDAITIFSNNSDYLRKPTVNSRVGDTPRTQNIRKTFIRKFYLLYVTFIWTEIKNSITHLVKFLKDDEIELEQKEINNIISATKKVKKVFNL